MQLMNLQIRRLNPYARDAEPLTELVFSDSKPWNPAPQPRRCVSGVELLKRFFEEEMMQSAANIDGHLQKLEEEHVLELHDVVLFDGTPMKIRLE
jgi:hypothetical protein